MTGDVGLLEKRAEGRLEREREGGPGVSNWSHDIKVDDHRAAAAAYAQTESDNHQLTQESTHE